MAGTHIGNNDIPTLTDAQLENTLTTARAVLAYAKRSNSPNLQRKAEERIDLIEAEQERRAL